MPFVTIAMFEGRTIEQKKQLAWDITDAVMKLGVPAESVHVLIQDVPRQNWADAGKLASER